MKMNKVVSVVLVSAAFATPAFANYFSNPNIGMNANVGSAPNPTPADLRADRMLPHIARSTQQQHVVQVATSLPRTYAPEARESAPAPRMIAPAPMMSAPDGSSTESSDGFLSTLWNWLPL